HLYGGKSIAGQRLGDLLRAGSALSGAAKNTIAKLLVDLPWGVVKLARYLAFDHAVREVVLRIPETAE
ncbi:MAG TPA: hypothetical protein VG898_04355, partial [Solirubrobacterales bacterium]|nr:hypothetical protein [Solirubrobacterales bacterium]